MKKTIIAIVLGVFLMAFSSQKSSAQSNKAFFVELLGNGLIFSANYDMRFKKETNGWGARLGIGYVGSVDGDGGVVTIPLLINNLLGKDGKYFEVGAGITYLSSSADFIGDNNASDIVGTMTFMYRKQPLDGGFMWKIGFTPILADGVFVPYWFGVGLGYSW